MGRRIEDAFRYFAAWSFAAVALLIVLGIPSLLLVTSTYGLGEVVRNKAETLLGGSYYKVRLGKVLFSPNRGFVLERIEVRDRSPESRLVVSANRVAVSLNMDALLRGNPRLERISLRNATLDIPLGSSQEPRLLLDHVSGEIVCPPNQLRVTDASFRVAGVRVRVSGTFLNPLKFAPRPVAQGGPGGVARTIDTIQRELRSVSWSGETPLLVIEAGGDLADPETLHVNRALLTAENGRWRGVSVRKLTIQASYGERILRLEKLAFEDDKGLLQAVGEGDLRRNNASLEFAGTINPAPWSPLLARQLKSADLVWLDPLRIGGSFAMDWSNGKPVPGGTLQFAGGRWGFRGLRMDSLSGGVALRDGSMLLRDLRVAGEAGELSADLMLAKGDRRLRLSASLFPEKLAPAARGATAETLSSMNFKQPLVIKFEGGMPGEDPMTLKGSGSLSCGDASMRGAAIEGLSARIEADGGSVAFKEILARMDGGTGRGEFTYDYKNWEGRFSGIRCSMDPVKVMTWIDPRIAEALKEYRFTRPPDVQLSGKVGLRDPEKNDLHIAVDAPQGLGYTLLGKGLSFTGTAGNVLLKGQKLAIDIPKARLFEGGVSLKADVSVAPGDGRYGASVHLDQVDFRSVTKLYFGYEESGGTLTADYSFRAVGGNDLAMTGKGNLLIQNGNVLAMPVLGPLSLLLGEVIPGFGYQTAREASADFSVENGVISTRNLLIKGKGFSMIGNGTIHYLEDRMNMNIRLNAQGLPGLVLFPVSKIFEYESVGSAKNPKWRPKLLPKIGGSATPNPAPAATSSPSP